LFGKKTNKQKKPLQLGLSLNVELKQRWPKEQTV